MRYYPCKYVEEFNELFGGKVAISNGAQLIDNIFTSSKSFDVDCYAALQEEKTSKPQTLSTTLTSTSKTRNLDNDRNTSSNDEDIVDHLLTEQQKGKRKASALAVKPMEPPPKKIKRTKGMFLAELMDVMSKKMSQQTKEMARQTAQREDEVVQMMKNLLLTH